MRVVFCKYPKDSRVAVGDSLTLKADALYSTGSTCIWEADLGKGWKKVGEGKMLIIKSVKKAHEGNYRCVIAGVASRVASVEVKDLTTTNKPCLEILKNPSEPEKETKELKKVTKKADTKTSLKASKKPTSK